jgi:hypothetical protein
VNGQKIQKFAGDVVYDIRSRGLLPIVILLALGVVVVPMLIKGGGSEATPVVPPPLPGTSEAGLQNQPAVLTYNPSVRDYRQRLDNLQQKDPFVQQFTSGSATDAAADTAGATTSTAPVPTGDTGSSGSGSSGSGDTTGGSTGGTGSGGGSSGGTFTHYFYFRETDILIGDTSAPLKRRNRVPDLSFLPSEKTPVLIYMGATRDAKTAVFLVSDDVTVVAGQDRCSPSPEDCQALRMHENDAVTLDNAVDAKSYRLKILDIRLVRSRNYPGSKNAK